jgi:hypothetical protein
MDLVGLSADGLATRLERHRRSGAPGFALILTDGSTVVAETNGARLVDETKLVLSYMTATEIRNIQIPVEKVVGTHPFNLPVPASESDCEGLDEGAWTKPSLMSDLADHATAQAKAHGFYTWSDPVAYLMRPPKHDAPAGPKQFTHSEVLYYDSEYLTTSGGLTGLGAGTAVAAGSLSWAPDVRKKAMRRIGKEPQSINLLCRAKRTACTKGYVEFYDLTKHSKAERAQYEKRVDTGPAFIPALVRYARDSRGADEGLVYFRNIWGAFPLTHFETWESIVQPIRLFGDVVHEKPDREMWSHLNCYLLVRSAGVVV